MRPVLLWFRRNLRVSDNAALLAAAKSGRPVIPVYVCDEQDRGTGTRWWLQHSLSCLDRDLQRLGSSLVLLAGSPQQVLVDLAIKANATGLYYTRRFEPISRRQEQDIHTTLSGRLEIEVFDDSYLHSPETVMTKAGTPYRVFTPFWNTASNLGEPPPPLPAPVNLTFAAPPTQSVALDDLLPLPTVPDKTSGYGEAWTPGESGGQQRIDDIDSIVGNYAVCRDRPDVDATSRLSPHLSFGEVSVRQVWQAVRHLKLTQRATSGGDALLRQLYWREFSRYLLFNFPDLPHKPLRPEFEHFPWVPDNSLLEAWQGGKTGYPIVDAGMRQLKETGWMHNRVRMIVASFLVKDLLVPWQTGAEWFLDSLVDADLANNSASWQWVAGCGSDAAPYFRVFNPTLQGKKFDPNGRYVRRWVPEIAESTYTSPIVDHAEARRLALDAYQAIKGIRISNSAP